MTKSCQSKCHVFATRARQQVPLVPAKAAANPCCSFEEVQYAVPNQILSSQQTLGKAQNAPKSSHACVEVSCCIVSKTNLVLVSCLSFIIPIALQFVCFIFHHLSFGLSTQPIQTTLPMFCDAIHFFPTDSNSWRWTCGDVFCRLLQIRARAFTPFCPTLQASLTINILNINLYIYIFTFPFLVGTAELELRKVPLKAHNVMES